MALSKKDWMSLVTQESNNAKKNKDTYGLKAEKARRATLSQDFLKAHPAPVGNVKSPIKMNLPEPLHEKNLRTKPLGRGDALLGGLMTGTVGGAGAENLRKSMPQYKNYVTAGELLGTLAPFGATYKGASMLTKGIANPLLKAGATGAIAGAPVGAGKATLEGKSPLDIAKEAALYGALGGVGDVAIAGLAPIAKRGINYMQNINQMPAVKGLDLSAPFKYTGPATPFRGTRSGMQMEPFTKVPLPKLPPTEIRQGLQREIGLTPDVVRRPLPSLRLNNIYKQSMDELQQGIQTAQNYVKHNDILAAYPPGTTIETAMADIKTNTGVDLPALMARAEETEKAPGLRQALIDDIPTTRLGQAAGVYNVPTKLSRGPNTTPRHIGASQEVVPTTLPQPKRMTRSGGVMLDDAPLLPQLQPIKSNNIKTMAESIQQPSKVQTMAESMDIQPEEFSLEIPVRPKEIAKEEVKNLNTTDEWKDKSKILLKRETIIRNIEDVAGKDAPRIIKKYITPIGEKEAEAIRFMNKEREQIAKLGIKPRSKESELVQKYGEHGWSEVTRDKTGKVISEKKRPYTLIDLKRDAPENWEKIVHASNVIKAKYKKYLRLVNTELTKNGYDPIPERPDYMRHFQEMTGIFQKFGIPKKAEELPVDLNGLTDTFKPGKNFFANALKRKGNETALDAITGIDGYVEGVSRLIYQTDNIQRLRGLIDGLRTKYEGTTHLSRFVSELEDYTNILAGKKTRLDRGDEELFDRSVYKTMDWLRSQNARNLATSLSSAMTNFIPLTQSIATTSKPSMLKAFGETVLNYLKNDGFINRSDFLTRRIGSDPLSLTLWQKAGNKSFFMMRAADNFVSQLITRGKYNEFVSKGTKPDEAVKMADRYAARVMGDRSRGGMPTLFHARGLKGFFLQFQLEVNNQLSFLTKDIPRHHEIEIGGHAMPKALATGLALTQVAIFSNMFNDVFEKLAGYRPAIDPIGSFEKAKKEKNDPTISTEKWWVNLAGDISNQLPFAGTFTGGRIPLSAAMPDLKAPFDKDKTTGQKVWDTLERPILYLAPPGLGGQIRKTYKGAKALDEGGVYTRKGNLMYPADPKETAKTLLFGPNATPEARDYWNKGRYALYPNQTEEYKKTFEKGINRKGQTAREQYNELRKGQDTGSVKKKVKSIDDEIKALMKNGGKGSEIKKLSEERQKLIKWLEGRK